MADADQLAAQMHAFYPHYIDSFNGDDQPPMPQTSHFPASCWGGGRAVTIVKDAAAWLSMMANAKAIMRSKGWARTGIEKTYAWPTAPDMGLLIFLQIRA